MIVFPQGFLILSSFAVVHVVADCFLPNGTDSNVAEGLTNSSKSCGFTWPGAQHSMCCRIGDNPIYDVCNSDGTCKYIWGPVDRLWREGCTDQTWEDPGCLRGLFTHGVRKLTVDQRQSVQT